MEKKESRKNKRHDKPHSPEY
jgi:hypothetical protein